MATLIIAEKASQARDLRAALGARFGQILAAEGHLLRLAEPEEVNSAWKSWSCVVLKPDGLFPTRPSKEGSKPAKLKAIAAALRCCDDVILATDCDREGQLIGQEILDHVGYRGRVRRALFTAQDPKTLQQAFARLKPNAELRPLYEAAVARQQADQIFNLSLTRTATKTLLAPGVRGVIGIGRVKTPTLAIVCLRELEIRNFQPEDYFEIVATATVAGGSFPMRHAPSAKMRINLNPAVGV
jgi:DNA topoisomerase-3